MLYTWMPSGFGASFCRSVPTMTDFAGSTGSTMIAGSSAASPLLFTGSVSSLAVTITGGGVGVGVGVDPGVAVAVGVGPPGAVVATTSCGSLAPSFESKYKPSLCRFGIRKATGPSPVTADVTSNSNQALMGFTSVSESRNVPAAGALFQVTVVSDHAAAAERTSFAEQQ